MRSIMGMLPIEQYIVMQKLFTNVDHLPVDGPLPRQPQMEALME